MKFKYFLLISLAGICLRSSAQEYSGAIGLRGGISSGFTYRHFFDDEIALETLVGFRRGGLQATLLRQTHRPYLMELSDNIILGYGFGGHVGFMYTDQAYFMFDKYTYPDKKFLPLIGIDGYVGIEYIFREFPLAVSLDCKPFFEVNIEGLVQLNPLDIAFAVKYWF